MSIKLENVGIAVQDIDQAVAVMTDLALVVIGRELFSGKWADSPVG